MPTLTCYLLRDDGEWFAMGTRHEWETSFAMFPGPPDGSMTLLEEDAHLLGLRLDNEFELAAKIIHWAKGRSFRFRTDLDHQVPVDGLPSPITGSWDDVLPTNEA